METLTIYKTDGTCSIKEVPREKVFDTIKEAVGGMVEITKLGGQTYAVNEEGLLLGLKRNPTVTAFVGNVVHFNIEALD